MEEYIPGVVCAHHALYYLFSQQPCVPKCAGGLKGFDSTTKIQSCDWPMLLMKVLLLCSH
jgi:hypothetical protein